MNTNDRRVKRTKKLLKEALAKLLMNKELREISIKELTDLADISRGAFYTHYQDIYDLYEQMENDLLYDLKEIIIIDPTDRYEIVYSRIIDYIYDNADICRTFMSTGKYREKFARFVESLFIDIVKYEMKTDTLNEESMYLIRYQNDGFVSVLNLWLESDFSLPKDKLIRLITDVDNAIDPIYLN